MPLAAYAPRRIIQFKWSSRGVNGEIRLNVVVELGRAGILSVLRSQSLFALPSSGSPTITLVYIHPQGGEEKLATDGGRAIRNRTVLRFGLVVLFKGPGDSSVPARTRSFAAGRDWPSSRNMMIAGCYHLQ